MALTKRTNEIRAARRALDVSQVELAVRACVHPNTVVRLEAGVTVSAPILERVMRALAEIADERSRGVA